MAQSKSILFISVLGLLLAACGAQQAAGLELAKPTTTATVAAAPPTATAAVAAVSPTATAGLSSPVSNEVPASCPITRPQNPLFTPPPPWPPQAPYGEFWYGTETLWTALQPDGKWWGLPHNPTGYTQKVWFWKQGYNGSADPTPDLTVIGRRLDAAAPPLIASKATNGYHPDFDWAMLVGVDLPTLGCWEITGHIDDRELSFVVWVAP